MANDLIKERIRKLYVHAESAKKLGSLAEAETFSSKVTELLLEHNLELSEIDLKSGESKFDKWMYSERVSYRHSQAGDRWQLNLIQVLCNHNLCSYVFRAQDKTFAVYGRMENVDTVIWLFNYLSNGLYDLALSTYKNRDRSDMKFYRYSRYSFLKDFLIGASVGINNKLELQKQVMNDENKITDLIHVNKDALNEYLYKTNPNVRKVNMRSMYVGAAYKDGIKAGEGYNINKPLSQSKTKYINS